jgi:exodeoxyribonuclease V beta subunit
MTQEDDFSSVNSTPLDNATPVSSASTDSSSIILKNLNAASIALCGKHLIEASAGTGKTYNITRIYLRLLLERELTVEQILLMTFTKDATQELRGRIDAFIRLALNEWQQLCSEEEKQCSNGEADKGYFSELDKRIDPVKREFLLRRALLFLDEAAIFTIHGFCQRVLSQYAFTSGLPFNANMAANSSDITLQVCQDWYRSLAKSDVSSFTLLASFWSTPESFLSSFSKAIGHTSALSVIDVQSIIAEFTSLAKKSQQVLITQAPLLENALILVKKGADQEKRREELSQLLNWLDNIVSGTLTIDELSQVNAKMPDAFFDGKRYAKSVHKAELLEAFAPVKQLKEQLKTIATQVDKAKAYAIVKSGIYSIRQKVIEQKQALNLLDFDDLINTLANCLADETSSQLAEQLLGQYPVALIDEFQDTDPKQFGILQAIYYGDKAVQANAGLFLIGDPKQAIYGFRGGDIFAYLNARNGCDHHWLMDTNWRSTPEMIAGYNQVFSYKSAKEEATNETVTEQINKTLKERDIKSVFGYGIPYLPVLAGKASKPFDTSSTEGLTDSNKALQFIHFTDSEQDEGKVTQSSRPVLAQWCAAEISSLLTNESSVVKSNSVKSSSVKPKDIAILVRDGAEARDIKHALEQAGLDSVFLSDRANLFHSQQAKQLLSLLKGVLLPENERVFVAALSCGLLGFNARKLHQLQEDEIAYQTLKFAFVDYRQQWQRQGFITMAINLMHQRFDVPQQNKDRCLTNILHLFEILQAASVRLSQGQELLHWFEQQCHLDTNEVEAELRLESDGDLIRLITQHGSKGLEYPYVFVPFACRHKDPLKFGVKSVSYLEYHDEHGKLCLSLDGSKEAKKAMSDEAYAESIRLLYVAITRAEGRCYIFSCGFDAYHLSPLGKTLQLAEQDSLLNSLQLLTESAPQAIGIREVSFDSVDDEHIGHAQQAKSSANSVPPKTVVSKFTSHIERDWWLSSFTALSRNIRHAGVSNPDRDTDTASIKSEDGLLDEWLDELSSIEQTDSAEQICFTLAKGAHTGNLLHDILEHTDFTQPNWQESIEGPLLKYGDLNANQTTRFTEDDLIHWLAQVINMPFIQTTQHEVLGCLADIPQTQSLRESEFYFPMQGEGTSALAKLLTDHRNCAEGNKSGYSYDFPHKPLPNPVMLPSHKKLSGMMHGFIDLIFEFEGKYYLSDYKSNHLGDNFQDYQFDALRDNVEKNYYDLQYLIYALALHRYLAQTLADYDVNLHFGGVYYLYLRGMTSDLIHKESGVYYRYISEQELGNLDALFSRQDELITTSEKGVKHD